MPDAQTPTSKPRPEKPPINLPAIVPVQEARDAIRKSFPVEGDLRVRHLWSTDGFSRFRANWFCGEGGKATIVKSLFLCATRTENGLVVENVTAGPARQ